MKKLVHALICLSISLVVLNCTNEEQMPVQGKVQIAINLASKSADGGRTQFTSFPEGAYISLSIETAAGTAVYSLEHVDLIQLGDGYVTAPLDLTEGNYRLTDFFVMSEGGDVLFATPREGSDLAGLVDDPLPILFTISADGIVNLDVQVVDVDQQSPEDFGYVSFGVEVVEGGDYAVSLFVADGNELSLASGKLELYQGNDLVHEQTLDAKVNAVNFKGDPGATYTLFVSKEGYTIGSREYVLSELLDELNGQPLTFMLEPAFTIAVKHHSVYDNGLPMTFTFSLAGVPGATYNLTIDWGDGTVDVIQDIYRSDGWSSTSFYLHFYSESLGGKPGYINITGDISNANLIETFNSIPLSMKAIDMTRLTNLDLVHFDGSVIADEDFPDHLDISKNLNLTGLGIDRSGLKSLDISNHPLLTRLAINDTDLTNENVNEVIMDLPERSGVNINDFFGFGKSENSDQQNLAILTPESRLKLTNLRDNYGWEIYPNPQ